MNKRDRDRQCVIKQKAVFLSELSTSVETGDDRPVAKQILSDPDFIESVVISFRVMGFKHQGEQPIHQFGSPAAAGGCRKDWYRVSRLILNSRARAALLSPAWARRTNSSICAEESFLRRPR